MECSLAANKFGPDEQVAALGSARSGAAAARAPRTEFVVLTRSDELLEQLGQLLDGAGDVRHAENEEEARQCADPRHATVMLLDSREHVDPGLVVERLHASDGSTVIVVFAPAGVVTDVARAIKGSAAFAVLPIPIEVEKSRAVLHGAGEEAMSRHLLASPPQVPAPVIKLPEAAPRVVELAPEAPVVLPRPVAARPQAPQPPESPDLPATGGGARRSVGTARLALAVLVGLSVVAAAAWFVLRDGAESPTSVASDSGPTPAAAEPVVADAPVEADTSRPEVKLSTEPKEELLDRARAAFHDRRYTDPEGDNALHYYRSVLAQDPQDGEAREGLNRIGGVLQGRLESALADNRFDVAARTLEQLRLVQPGDPALAGAEAKVAEQRISAALARGDVEQAAELVRAADRAGVPAQRLQPLREQLARVDGAQRAERLSRLVSARIRDGQLLAPPGDSAKFHLGQLLKLPNGKRLGAAASDELALAFAERAKRAAAQGQVAEAEQWLAEAKALGYVPERPAAAVAAQVQAQPVVQPAPRPADAPAPVRQEGPAVPVARATTPDPLVRPAPVAASRAPAAPAEVALSAADFKRTRYVAPTYPQQALSRGLSGEVRVRLKIDTKGQVADVEVLSASPAGVFDQAAVNAVRKWRFEPVVRDGRAIEASVTTTISFQPDSEARR